MTELLALEGLTAGYGTLAVVRDLDLRVDDGEIVTLLGPNGAGKTTTLLTACGFLDPMGGSIRLCGQPFSGRHPGEAARRGVSLVPEDRALFFDLTVVENLRVGSRGKRPPVQDALDLFPELASIADRKAGLLSGGQQQMLAIARGLAARPRLLVVDEMSLGLAPLIVQRLLGLLRDVVDRTGIAVLLVEQHVHLALGTADRAYVLSHGELVLDGPAADLRDRDDLLEVSYLGDAALDPDDVLAGTASSPPASQPPPIHR
jgi:branched-chain amino acid transport system ATP-binding protein